MAITSIATVAHADSASDADALVDHGVQLREQGKDDLALKDFQRAYALSPSARALAQVGLAEQALGMWRDAERDVGAALETSGDPWIEKNRGALEAAKSTIASHLATLEIRCDAPDAEIFVDGGSRGKLAVNGAIRVESGTHDVEIRAPGRHASSRSVMLTPGGVARETVALEPLAASTSTSTSTSTSASPSTPTSSASPGDPNGNEVIGAAQRSVGWAFLGTSAALVVTGFAGIGARSIEITSYNDDPSCPGLASVDQPPLCQSKIATAQTWTTVSIVGFVGAGVLATGGAILLLTSPPSVKIPSNRGSTSPSPRSSSDTSAPSFACGAALGIYCAGRF